MRANTKKINAGTTANYITDRAIPSALRKEHVYSLRPGEALHMACMTPIRGVWWTQSGGRTTQRFSIPNFLERVRTRRNKQELPQDVKRFLSPTDPHEGSLSRFPHHSCQRWIDQGGTKTRDLVSTTDINKTVVARSSVRKEIEVALQNGPDVHVLLVGFHDRGVNRAGVVRLHKRDLPDGRSPEQVLGHPGLRVDEPHARGVPGVGKRSHHLQNKESGNHM